MAYENDDAFALRQMPQITCSAMRDDSLTVRDGQPPTPGRENSLIMVDTVAAPSGEDHCPIRDDLNFNEAERNGSRWQGDAASNVAGESDQISNFESSNIEASSSMSEALFEAELAEDLAEYVSRSARFEAFQRAYQDVG